MAQRSRVCYQELKQRMMRTKLVLLRRRQANGVARFVMVARSEISSPPNAGRKQFDWSKRNYERGVCYLWHQSPFNFHFLLFDVRHSKLCVFFNSLIGFHVAKMEPSEVKISYKETDTHLSVSTRLSFHISTISTLSCRKNMSEGGNVNRLAAATPAQIAETQRMTWQIKSNPETQMTAYACKIDNVCAPILESRHVNFPNLTTVVEVVAGDTFDRAIDLSRILPSRNHKPVCVLNFANARIAGGGWLGGSPAQEEQLFYRSTLSASLVQTRERLYPMGELEGIYSPLVYIFRENVESHYQFMKRSAVVSVISMAAEHLKQKDTKYQNPATRDTMKRKMRIILRAAGQMHHRRLALGALGCGAFHHPAQEVANCWKGVLQEPEFKGWFERIWFIIRDAKGKENNFAIFKPILHNLVM
jgi:uncharacterized protein (TIGR02452 family)